MILQIFVGVSYVPDEIFKIGSNPRRHQQFIKSAMNYVSSRHLNGMDLLFNGEPRFESFVIFLGHIHRKHFQNVLNNSTIANVNEEILLPC